MPRTPNTALIDNALVTLTQAGEPMTRQDLGLSHHYVRSLLASGRIVKATDKAGNPLVQKVVNTEGNLTQGHPHNLYKPSKSGRDRARRILAKAAKADQVQEAPAETAEAVAA